jgi:hypothetical protein
MFKLKGLPNTQEIREALNFETSDQAIFLLNQNVAGTASGESGSINVWDDNDGKLRCNLCRMCITFEEAIFETVEEVSEWIDEHLDSIA